MKKEGRKSLEGHGDNRAQKIPPSKGETNTLKTGLYSLEAEMAKQSMELRAEIKSS